MPTNTATTKAQLQYPPRILGLMRLKFLSENSYPFGLGLVIVRDIAAYHGGQFVLENRSEGGSLAGLVLA